jgi:subtilase family serine protease
MRIRGRGTVPALLLSIVFFFCFLGAASAGHIQLNSYSIDVKGQEPTVPADLEPSVDGKYKKWIVQFTGPVQEADKKTLVDLGCRVGDYLPDFAFIVTMDNKTRKKVEKLAFVNGIVRYKPAYKIDKKLKNDSGEVRVGQGKKIRLIVKLDGKDNQSIVLSETHKKKGTVLDVSGDIVRIEVDQADISHFAQIEEVLWIEEATDLQLLNDTTKWTIQTYLPDDTRIWSKGIHGEGQIIGIGDSGLDYDMPWFRDPAGTAVGPGHRKVVGYDPTYGDDYDYLYGHGTHVAGTVGGDRTPVDGLSNANGMAPKSKYFFQDLTPGASSYVYPPSDLGLLFIKAYDAGARIHTNSWGNIDNSYSTISLSADRFLWEHKDFLALFANGNSGPGAGTVGSPATAKNVVSVGASLNGTGAENVASFSSNGPTADGRIKPTITAPGDGMTEGAGIVSADSDGLKESNNSGTRSKRGTSMATPAAAGAAALVRQYFTEGYYPTGAAASSNALSPSAALIKATLINSGQNMIGNNIDASIPSTGQGWGRINLSNTLCFSGDPKTLEVVDHNIGLTTGQSWSRTYAASAGQPLKVTLVWTDYPGASGAAKALVNDLDLTVTAPDGTTTYLGNVFSNGESATGGSADRLNVEEQVFIKTPSIGSYTITVTGYNIPYGPQPFALVITPQGVITLNKMKYNGSSTVVIGVVDKDMNLSNTAIDELFVTIAGTSEPEGEQVRLVETGAATAVFTGTIPLRVGAPAASDGFLEVSDGDIITTTYNDVDDGTGHPATVTATAVIDTTPPVISAVASSSLAEIQASITWNTNEPADSTINYGETTALGISRPNSLLQTQHSMDLINLKEGTTYYYEVISRDEAGNLSRDDNGGSLFSFATTNLPPDLTVYSSVGSETSQSSTTIYGTAKDHSGIASVTVNGVPASYRSSDGYYERGVALVLGDNTFLVAATDGAGNVQLLTMTVKRLPQPDLTMAAVSGPASAGTGKTITVSDAVSASATGGHAGSFSVGIYLSTDNVITSTDKMIGYRAVSSLSAGASSASDTTVTVPTSIAPGAYYLGVIADYANAVVETDETNNTLAGGQISIVGSDLTLNAVSAPASAFTGKTIMVSTTVFAAATGGNAGEFFVGIYLSTDNVITTADRFIGNRTVSSISSGASSASDTPVTIPTSITPGTYYLGVIADYTNKVQESDETNNALAGNQIAIVGPDLTMTFVSGPASGSPGMTITVSNTVSAAATGGNAGNFDIGIYLSTDTVITTADTLIGYRYVGSLSAGALSASDTTVTIPTSTAPGDYYLGVIADYSNSAGESDETNNALTGNQITVMGADLMMTAVSAPASASTGNIITVNNTVSAAATGLNAGYFYVGIYLSTDNVITIADTLIGYRYVSSLAAGASNAADTTVTIPTSIAPGDYYLGVIADHTNTLKESDETNNALAGNQITVVGPDLKITTVSGPASVGIGTTVAISNTVSASATGGNAGYSYVGIYLSADAVITTADTRIGYRYVGSLAAGASSAADTTLTISASIAPGTYYLGVIADYSNTVQESDETNNALTGNQITIVGPDLTMTAVSGPASGVTGGEVTISNIVTAVATGGNAASFYVGIYFSTDATITTADTLLGLRYLTSLSAGEAIAHDTSALIPTSLKPGTYYLGAIADYENSVIESDETNNVLLGGQFTVIGPDLTVSAVSGPASSGTNANIAISTTVAASASGGNAGSFDMNIYLSTDSTITTSDRKIGFRSFTGMAAGATSTADTVANIPVGIPPGTYYIGAIVDIYNWVTESDETNNSFVGNQITLVGPDLAMSAVSGPAQGGTNGTLTVTNTVSAAADAGNVTSFSVGFYLSTDATITTSDIKIGSRTVYNLSSGASSTEGSVVTIPATVLPGTYYIGAIADFYDNILESDETNNALVGNQITVVGPDLTMAAVSGPANAGTGAAITVSNTVAAASSAGNPASFSVGIYLSLDVVITASDTRIGYRTVSSLASGASSTADTAVTIPTSIAAGTYYLGVIADYGNAVKESDETNNALAGDRITIIGPDLTATAVSGPSSVRVGASMTLDYTVKNGDGGGNADWSYVGLYLSTDNVITTSDIRLGYHYVAAMAAGAAISSQNTVTVPSTLAPGTYYIGAIADYSNNVAESDETNNALAGSQITVIGPDLTISSVSAPAVFPVGGSVAVTATVIASADGADVSQGFSVCLYLSQDATITESDTYLGQWSVSSLAAGQSSSATTAVAVPSSLTFGATYYVGAVADCRYNYVKESDETNNAGAGNAVAVVGPDLALTEVSGPATAAFGAQATVTTTVTNATEGDVPGTFYVHMFLSDDSTITSSDTYIGSRVISGMGPGASSTETTTVTIPSTLKRGTYYIGAIVDYLNSVNETDETNNALAGNTIFIKR